MVKNILLSMCFLFLSFSNYFASNANVPIDLQRWQLLVFGKDGLWVFLDTDSYYSYVNSYSLGHSHCKMANIWEWHTPGNDNPDNIFYTIDNITYDFNCRTLQLNRIVEYDKDNKCIGNFSFDNQPMEVVPGSLGERLLDEVEKYDKQRNS